MRRRNSGILAALTAVAVSCGLAACAPGEAQGQSGPDGLTVPAQTDLPPATEPVPSATPTHSIQAYTSPPPTSTQDALSHAARAIANYYAAYSEVITHPADTTGFDLVAKGQQLDDELRSFQDMVNRDRVGRGQATVEFDVGASFVTDLTEHGSGIVLAPFGAVTAVGCLDVTGVAFSTAGAAFTGVTGQARRMVTITVLYEPGTSSWLIADMRNGLGGTGEVTPC